MDSNIKFQPIHKFVTNIDFLRWLFSAQSKLGDGDVLVGCTDLHSEEWNTSDVDDSKGWSTRLSYIT